MLGKVGGKTHCTFTLYDVADKVKNVVGNKPAHLFLLYDKKQQIEIKDATFIYKSNDVFIDSNDVYLITV